jgi:hypothetical protein
VDVNGALTARKRHELRAHSESLERELEHWTAVSEDGCELEKHNSQIRAVVEILDEQSRPVLARARSQTIELDDAGQIEADLLDLHRLWDYFRDKLAVRYVEWLRDPLEAADRRVSAGR